MDRHDRRGPDVSGDLGSGPRAEVARTQVRTPRPDGEQGEIHGPGHVAHLWEWTRVAGEVHPSAVVQDVAQGMRPWRARRDPMARRNGFDPQTLDLDGFACPDLDHLPRPHARAPRAKPTRHDQDRTPGQAFEGRLVEVVSVAVRDDDHIGLEVGGIGEGTVSLERPEPRPKERVREDANSTKVDERRRVADESNRDRSRRRWFRVRPSARRSGHRFAPARGAAGSDGGGG